ncbi:hypothetical protein VC83_04165 [Pseudogymnoascus destructans]|uniref:Uncharacterized protein n=1 Tax=Pseudogymnoascus destructans TaxID=655981 RepID=A0A177AC13_9PEZI|nr:uncharacterized protein VC83_04165 [Pseudogymnoascus destructans]OAF59330.1 hypothetical protein VC83_04165 [Pseudogymnoascus destructans]
MIKDTGCSLLEGPRRFQKSTNRFAFPGSRCRDRRHRMRPVGRPEADFRNRPTVSRGSFHEAVVVTKDTGSGLLRGPRQIWDIDQPSPVSRQTSQSTNRPPFP